MRFWITTVLGVIALTGIGTLMFVRNPDMQKQPKIEVKKDPVIKVENAPVAVAAKVVDKVENVPQWKEGKSVFEIKNTGKSTLKLTLGKKSCTCISTEIDKEEVAPGESTKFTINWNSKSRVGQVGVSAVVETNDPEHGSLGFTTQLDIVQDLLLDPPDLQFGRMHEGEVVERSAYLFAPNFENFQISDLTTSSKAFVATSRPMTKEELSANNRRGRSGVKITVKCDGRLPVGEFQENVAFKSNSERVPTFKYSLFGQVEGNIRLSPSKLDFGPVVDVDKAEPQKQLIFAPGLGAKETLTVGSIEPNYVAAALERNKDFPTQWSMLVRLTKDTPSGEFKCWVSLVDSKGKKRISVPVSGIMPGIVEAQEPIAATRTGQ